MLRMLLCAIGWHDTRKFVLDPHKPYLMCNSCQTRRPLRGAALEAWVAARKGIAERTND